MIIDNFDNTKKCFPGPISGEFYNVDFSVIFIIYLTYSIRIQKLRFSDTVWYIWV